MSGSWAIAAGLLLSIALRRGLSPLFWSNASLYGTIDIEMDRHLDLGLAA